MRLLVLGSGGMLGFQVFRMANLINGIEARGAQHWDTDICDKRAVKKLLDRIRPQTVINCAGIVKGRDVPDSTYLEVNGAAPQMVSELCDEREIRFVQVSTDCVFAGDGPHYETDLSNAEDLYGRSKQYGEIEMGRHMTVRCSFVGPGERGLLGWLFQQTGEVDGYINVLWNGMSAPAAAKLIVNMAVYRPDLTGIQHIHGPDTTKYHVLRAANEVYQLGLTIRPVDTPVADYRLRTHNSPGMIVADDIGAQLATKELMG